jgi:flagellar hook-basal body complex protein FliE
MSVSPLQNINRTSGLDDLLNRQTIPVEKPKQEGFGDLLKQMVNDVNELQHKAADKEKQFLRGEITDVHQVMIAAEEASVAFSLLMEIRNKLLDSYKEIMRMNA